MRVPLMMLMMVSIALFAKASEKSVKKDVKLRAPAIPLLSSDPYFGVWSTTDNLNESNTVHWTGRKHPLIGALRVDGISYRFMGVEEQSFTAIVPTANEKKWEAVFTENQPDPSWTTIDYNDKDWSRGTGAFGTKDSKIYSTLWESKDIWVRRTFDLKEDFSAEDLFLKYSHDDIFELFINGVQVVKTGYTWNNDVLLELDAKTKKLLKSGRNVIAAHCHNKVAGGFIDFGLLKRNDIKSNFHAKAIQKSVSVLPTQTHYSFDCGPVELNLTFTAPLLMEDLDLISTPINYISYDVYSKDNKKHQVQIYFETTPQLTVNSDFQFVKSEKILKNSFTYLKTGTIDQEILGKKGDDLRIDWGHLYLGGQLSNQEKLVLGEYYSVKEAFISEGKLPADTDPADLSENMKEEMTVLAYCHDLGEVSKNEVQGHLMIGYDDRYSIQYFHENLLPYWKHNGQVNIFQAFEKASRSYESLMTRCAVFDQKMMSDAEAAGGVEYAELCALAYRQAIVAHKLVEDKEGNLLFLSKENHSNGCINTVDLTYPSAPLFLLYNTELMKGMLNPIFYYSESGRWKKPFPAHDLGTYPIANGQEYGGDMPVEEGGNMLLVTTAVSIVDGNAEYARKHWDVLTTWVNYLLKEGLDPENQLCTDDFAGHSAHNTNLSIKAIMGIAGYSKMAGMLGKDEVAAKYMKEARIMAGKWTSMADDGDHYRLTFDQPNTWSQKYNLVWDKILGLNVFPAKVAKKEIAYYLKMQKKYGLPLDSRKSYTKSDWVMWSACLADSPKDFKKIVAPIYKYANETPSRIPLSDWHETTDAVSINFKARSVVGGYFMKMLDVKLNPQINK
ncbi:MAG: DUF4965 domain-containing protein [Labilibaculum sp.]|nr:DUF4965 domain-containing protein [Labilibaculum sp.]